MADSREKNLEQNLYLIKSVKISVLLLLKGENIYLKSWKSIRSRHKMNQITTQVSIFETQKPRNLCRVILIFHKTILNFRTRKFSIKMWKIYFERKIKNNDIVVNRDCFSIRWPCGTGCVVANIWGKYGMLRKKGDLLMTGKTSEHHSAKNW